MMGYYKTEILSHLNHQYAYSLAYSDYERFADSVCPVKSSAAMLYNQAAVQETPVDTNSCVADAFSIAVNNAALAYQAYIDSVHRDFREAFLTKCMNVQPRLTMTGSLWEYQYTLYYYGQAGNLVKTVPPQGVHLLSRAGVDSVQLYRKYGRSDCYLYSNYMTVNPPAGSQGYYQLAPDSRFYTGSNPFTIEMWVKLNDLSDQGLVSNYYHTGTDNGLDNAGFSLSLYQGKLQFYLFAGVGLFSYPNPLNPSEIIHTAVQFGYVKMASDDISPYLHTGQWTHIVVERMGATTAAMYIDGVPIHYSITGQAPFTGGNGSINPPAGAPLNIGAGLNGSSALMGMNHSAIKQFRLYKRALSYSEIRQNLFSTCLTPASQIGLTVWMPLNDMAISDIATGTAGQEAGDPSWFTLNQSLWPTYPKHTLVTYYQYNSLNEVARTTSPDGGTTQSWYDRLGRLLASQNSEQRHPVNGGTTNRYSYTKYDALGRIIEVGEKTGAADLNTIDTKDSAAVSAWLASGTNGQATFTHYDDPYKYNYSITPYQTNLRKRVAAAYYSDDGNMDDYNAATHYSYDIEGNVKTLWQDIKYPQAMDPTTGLKRIDYDISACRTGLRAWLFINLSKTLS